MKRSSIDIGSNTVLLLIGEVVKDRIVEMAGREQVTSLGKGLDRTKKFAPRSMQDTLDVLGDYRNVIEDYGLNPEETLVTATEASRVAINAKDFFRKIEDRLGFRIHVISEEGEAYYTFRGVVQSHEDTGVIMDIGGASTELIKVSDGSFERMISLPVGSVRGSDWREEGCFEKRLEDIFADERLGTASFQTDRPVGVGGTMTSLAAISKNMSIFECDKLEGCSIGLDDWASCIERIEGQSEEELNEKFPFLGKRVKSIKVGGRLSLIVGEFLGIHGWKISTKGLRHGTLREGRIDERFKR